MAIKAGYKGIKRVGPGLNLNREGVLTIKGDSPTTLDQLSDVEITDPLSGDVIRYDSTNDTWENEAADTTPAEDSDALITSGGVYAALEGKVSWEANGLLGAKNILPMQLNSGELNGLTFIVNTDGSFSINGTASSNTDIPIASHLENILKVGVRYKLTGMDKSVGSSEPPLCAFLWRLNNSSAPNLPTGDFGDGSEFTWQNVSGNVTLNIRVDNGITLNNITFYPMIRIADDTDPTYQPHAMTNEELTKLNVFNGAFLDVSSDERITNADVKVAYKAGHVVNVLLQFKCTETELNAEITAFTLPEKYRPHAVHYFRSWDIGSSATDENQEIIINPNGTIVLKLLNTHNTARWIYLDCTFLTSN